MRKLFIAALLLAAPLVSACNTVEGFGKDLQKAGDNLEDEANEAKK